MFSPFVRGNMGDEFSQNLANIVYVGGGIRRENFATKKHIIENNTASVGQQLVVEDKVIIVEVRLFVGINENNVEFFIPCTQIVHIIVCLSYIQINVQRAGSSLLVKRNMILCHFSQFRNFFTSQNCTSRRQSRSHYNCGVSSKATQFQYFFC